jgi:glucose-1-phosphate adenylyltransferase
MQNAIAFILCGGQGERLYPLTKDRAKPAVPFGGMYRIIDFTLSNCLNSSLKRLFLLTQYKSFALEKHIYSGWNVFAPGGGEFIHLLPPQQRMKDDWYLGTADAVFQNFYSLRAYSPDYVFVLSGDHVYKMDYRKMLRYHRRHKADVTIGMYPVPIEQASRFGVIEVDDASRIVGFYEKPRTPISMPQDRTRALVSMGVYLFDTQALAGALMADAEDERSEHDFGRNVIPNMMPGYRVLGYEFDDENRGSESYWRDVGTIDDYYAANMDLVEVSPKFNLYDERWPVHTMQPQLPCAKTVWNDVKAGRVGQVLQSLVAQGCIVSGGRVERSILSPRVRVNSFAEVSDSILLDGVTVGRRARVRRAIVDKRVQIPDGYRIGFDATLDRRRFKVTESGIVVVSKEQNL